MNSSFLTFACATLYTLKYKKFNPLPLASFGVFYYYYSHKYLLMHNKRFFDMLNVGEEYELGYHRNAVLRKCNEILDTEDFW